MAETSSGIYDCEIAGCARNRLVALVKPPVLESGASYDKSAMPPLPPVSVVVLVATFPLVLVDALFVSSPTTENLSAKFELLP